MCHFVNKNEIAIKSGVYYKKRMFLLKWSERIKQNSSRRIKRPKLDGVASFRYRIPVSIIKPLKCYIEYEFKKINNAHMRLMSVRKSRYLIWSVFTFFVRYLYLFMDLNNVHICSTLGTFLILIHKHITYK